MVTIFEVDLSFLFLTITPFPPDSYRDFPQGGRSIHISPLGENERGLVSKK